MPEDGDVESADVKLITDRKEKAKKREAARNASSLCCCGSQLMFEIPTWRGRFLVGVFFFLMHYRRMQEHGD